jgi:hypothetical protein
MNQSAAIYIIPSHSIFNVEKVPQFGSFDAVSSSKLYEALYLNLIDSIGTISGATLSLCLAAEDKGHLSADASALLSDRDIIYLDCGEFVSECRYIFDPFNTGINNNIFLRTNTIGLTAGDIEKALDLLCLEEEIFISGISNSKNLSYIGFNILDEMMLKEFRKERFNYDIFLKHLSEIEARYLELPGYYTINTMDDFKLLYRLLSEKESSKYCSEESHKRFTDIFIENKDLL